MLVSLWMEKQVRIKEKKKSMSIEQNVFQNLKDYLISKTKGNLEPQIRSSKILVSSTELNRHLHLLSSIQGNAF